MKLTFEMKYEKLSDSMNVICAQRDDLLKNTQELKNSHELLAQEHRETRKHYESLKEKHHKIIEELTVVKETILKMNIIWSDIQSYYTYHTQLHLAVLNHF